MPPRLFPPWRPWPACRALLAACTALLALQAHAEEVVIGWAGPDQQPHAIALRQAAQLAVDEANQRNLVLNGKPLVFRLLAYNDNDNANVAVFVARSLVTARAVAVIGHYTTEPTIAAARVYAEAHVPELAVFAPSPRLTQLGLDNVFQLVGNIATGTSYMAAALPQLPGAQRLAIAYNGSQMGQTVADTLEQDMKRQGTPALGRVSISARTSDFNKVLQMLSARQVDVLYFAGVQQQAYALSKRLKESGARARLLLTGGAFNPEFYEHAAPYTDGTMLLAHGHAERQLPGFARFDKTYMARFNSAPMPYAVNAYDAVGMVVEAIRRGGSLDPAIITANLHQLTYDGVSGRIAFDANGRLHNPAYTLYQVEQGKWKVLRSFP